MKSIMQMLSFNLILNVIKFDFIKYIIYYFYILHSKLAFKKRWICKCLNYFQLIIDLKNILHEYKF
jgi:hypothetical protein